MNKNKLTVTIICFVLIGFVALASIGQRNKQTRTEYITITRSTNTITTVADTECTTISETKTKKNIAVRTTTVSESVIVTETISEISKPLYININTADHNELMNLPDIGDVLAENIIIYRENYGYFRNIEEIMLVNGIGDGIFSKICDKIYVDNPVYDEGIIIETVENTEIPYEIESTSSHEITEEEEICLEDVIPINLNTADKELLMLLPYISEEYAVKIIELRDAIGKFSHPYEIYYAEILEPYQIEEICEYVTVDSSTDEEFSSG